MGKKQSILNKMLGGGTSGRHRKLNTSDIISSGYYPEIMRVYRALDGGLDISPCNLTKGDIELENYIVELDEEQHFNRYRKITLDSPIYRELPKFPMDRYSYYCNKFEGNCRTDNKFWTSDSSERQFGLAGVNGILEGYGAPRWKQRAFYDFLKDVSSLIIGTEYVRVSIYDTVPCDGKEVSVSKILLSESQQGIKALERLIKERKG